MLLFRGDKRFGVRCWGVLHRALSAQPSPVPRLGHVLSLPATAAPTNGGTIHSAIEVLELAKISMVRNSVSHGP